MKRLKKWLVAFVCAICSFCMIFAAACTDESGTSASSSSTESSSSAEGSSSGTTSSEETSSSGTTSTGDTSTGTTSSEETSSGGEEQSTDVIKFTQDSVALEFDTTATTATTLDLTAYLDSSTTVTSITWSSADEKIATVSAGTLTAVSGGSVVITAADSDGSVTATIMVVITAYEWVTTTMDMQTGYTAGYTSNGTIPDDYVVGRFTVNSGGRFESGNVVSGSYNMNTGGSATIGFTLQGIGTTNTISFNGKGASGSGVVITLTNTTTSTVYYTSGTIANSAYITEDNYLGTNNSSITVTVNSSYSASSPMLTISGLPAGDYTLGTSASLRISDLSITEYLGISAASGITTTATTVDFLEGSAFTASGLSVTANYENGSTTAVSSSNYTYKVYEDSSCTSEADTTALTSGVKYVKVSATVDEATFTDVYEITVYSLDSITLGHNGTVNVSKGSSSAYASSYNGVYYNQTTQKIFTSADGYDDTGLTVTATGVLGSETCDFILDDGWYTIDSSALKAATSDGDYEIKVTVTAGENTETASYYVSYVSSTISYDSTNDIAYIAVDGSYTGKEGAQVQNSEGTYENTFTTIEKALEYLEINQAAGTIKSSTTKQITIAAGYYNEKIEVTLANVHMIGAGSTGTAYTVDQTTTDFTKVTVIEWDSLYGQADESGYVQVTDSTATFNVRQSATGFYAEGITFSNYYNCVENFVNMPHGEHRALAMLIQADQVILKNCALLGYQDTVEFFTGRQYLSSCFISGTTDFIFGTNNTTLFESCTIYSVTAETSSGTTSSDGGYITAFKGCSSGASDYVTYGAIFYKCTFDAAENVLANKNTTIARPWGVYAAVAVIECELGAHISTAGHTSGTQKNERYVTMSGNEPTLETVKFVEYNNTGAGAITEAVAGMTMLDATTAEKYYDYSVIFGTTNGAVTYTYAWTPGQTITINTSEKYWYFDGTVGTEENEYTYTDTVQGTTAEWEGITIDATSSKVASRGSDTQINSGATLTFEVEAGALISIVSYSGSYALYTINGQAARTDTATTVFYATEAITVTYTATGQCYLYKITVQYDNVSASDADYTLTSSAT